MPAVVLVWLAALLTQAPGASSPGALPGAGDGPCTEVDLAADDMVCTAERCELTGNVQLFCQSLRVWADRLRIELTPEGVFAGAVATGDVLVVDRNRLITCDSIFLGADRVQARMDGATIHIKRGPDVMPVSRVPVGRDFAVLSGERAERLSEDELHIEDATFTLCDCGERPPSWRLTARAIDATVGERVTAWWPVFWVNPFGLGALVPITPPLPPLSLPLKSRAAGMLPPRIQILRFPWPLVDIPIFFPLGRSWDLTLTPGLRMDWSLDHDLTPPSTWGAWRLGGRLRYAPVRGTEGALTVDYTNDRKHGLAQVSRGSSQLDEQDPLLDLVHRAAVSWNHKTDLGDSLRLLIDADWVSDDFYTQHFGLSLSEQVIEYIPTRAQLQGWWAGLSAALAAEHFQRISRTAQDNLESGELAERQHGPAARLRLLPVALGAGVHVGGDATFDSYRPWFEPSAAKEPSVAVLHAAPVLSYLSNLGPVAMAASASLDWMGIEASPGAAAEPDTPAPQSGSSTAAIVDSFAEITLVRRFGRLEHVVTPRLSYRSIPWRYGTKFTDPAGTDAEKLEPARNHSLLDRRLRRDETFHQGMLGITQELWWGEGRGASRVVALELAQPFAIDTGHVFATRAALGWALGRFGSGGAGASMYLPALAGREECPGAEGRVLREASASLTSPPLGPLTVSAGWTRYAPEAGRFLRSMYEFEASACNQSGSWVHFASFRADLRLPPRLVAAYASSYKLRIPGEDTPQPGFTEHIVSLNYHSPCDCWDLGITAVFPVAPEYVDRTPRFSFLISIAGFRLGM